MNWLFESNRPKHVIAGSMIYIISFVLASLLYGKEYALSNVIISLFVTLVAGICVEYKDKLYGNKFDWLDVLATCISPLLSVTIELFINLITKWNTYF